VATEDMAKQNVDVQLKYAGPEVDDGTMSLEDFVPALKGFSALYTKVAATQNTEVQHKIRITGVSKGSVDIHLEIWKALGQNSDQIQALGTLGGGALFVLGGIGQLIKLVKHIKKEPHEAKPATVNNMVSVKNSENVTIEVPIHIYTLYKDGAATNDLNKLVKPLEEGRIDSAELEAREGKEEIRETISAQEKPYFSTEEPIVATTDRIWLNGKFNMLTKSTNRGYFILSDGSRVTYQLAMNNPENYYEYFIHKGLVRVSCVAHLDDSLKPSKIDIYEIEKLQTDISDLPFEEDEA
jgi:hypothetical protein